MKAPWAPAIAFLPISFFSNSLLAQQPAPAPASDAGKAPIYRVSVVQRNIKAVNYLYRQGPTPIDFRGTVLMPESKGWALVESKQGRTDIDANLEHLKASQEYGREYLTYVLWAISPEGRPHNLGEIIPDRSNKAHLHVTTDLQAFAMIVTAEPYSSVRQPSDVVVLENQLRHDTEGSTETVNAKVELLPRGQYTWDQSNSLKAEIAGSPKVSTREFETLTELYQSENAVGIAQAAGAAQYAPDTFARAQALLDEARQMHASKGESHTVIEIARQASETAEDARLIAVQRRQQAELTAAQVDANQARQQVALAQQSAAKAQADADTARASAEQARASAEQARANAEQKVQQAQQEMQAAMDRANAAQRQAEADRTALLQAQAQADQARQQAQQAQHAAAQAHTQAAPARTAIEASALRARLLENLNGVAAASDTPRGLVVTIPDSGFSGESVRGDAAEKIARVAAIVAAQPGLSVNVDGYSNSGAKQELSEVRAFGVRRVLTNNGLSPESISVRGWGDSRPVGPRGDLENSRVEIVISGDPIGSVPIWDRPYPLTSSAR